MRRYESLGAFTAVCMVTRLKYLRTLSNLDQRSRPTRRYGEQDQAADLWPQPTLPEAPLPAWSCPSARRAQPTTMVSASRHGIAAARGRPAPCKFAARAERFGVGAVEISPTGAPRAMP
jgi:hypothetical protein